MLRIPEILICEAYLNDAPVSGVMLQANFGMTRKNSYSFIFGPADSKGHTELDRSKVLSEAKAQLELAIIDFDPIEEGFNGNISVDAMSENDLRRALDAFQLFKSVVEYPEKCKENLEKALEYSNSRNADEIKTKVK